MAAVTHRRSMSTIQALVRAMAHNLPAALAFKLPVELTEVARLKVFHLAVHIDEIGVVDDIISRIGGQDEFESSGISGIGDAHGKVDGESVVDGQVTDIELVLVEEDFGCRAVDAEEGIG